MTNREIDALVAEKVMGWERWTCSDFNFETSTLFRPGAELPSWVKTDLPLSEHGAVAVPNFSTDIAAAWQVVEKLKEGWTVTMNIDQHDTSITIGRNCVHFGVDASTTALAICRVALKAVGVEVTEARG